MQAEIETYCALCTVDIPICVVTSAAPAIIKIADSGTITSHSDHLVPFVGQLLCIPGYLLRRMQNCERSCRLPLLHCIEKNYGGPDDVDMMLLMLRV